MSDYVATVAGIYQAFGEGNIGQVLNALSDEVQWEDFADNSATKAGVPWLARGHGKADAVRFFQIIGTWQFSEFNVVALMGGGAKVTAEIEIAVTQPSGVAMRDQELHLWTFNDEGKVSSFRHYVDTAKHIAAAGLVSPAAAVV